MDNNSFWLDKRGFIQPAETPRKANIYRLEIRGTDDVSYIEAACLRDAVHVALDEFSHAAHAEIIASLFVRDCTLAEFMRREPGLFEVV